MAKSSRGLSQQNGVFYARKGVPPEARPILGKTEIHRTLDTRDEGKALDALQRVKPKGRCISRIDTRFHFWKEVANRFGGNSFDNYVANKE